jgi:aspartate/methionine/tyrosine aminotransferase
MCQDAAVAAIRAGRHGYTPSAGIDELRAAAATSMGALRGIEISADEVVVGAGAKPFIGYTIASVTDYGAGDEVIFPVPGFPIYESQIIANGAVPVPLPLRESRGFAFDPAEVAARIGPKTRLLILNTPHNPTGGILDRAALEAIAEVLRDPGVWITPTRSAASWSTTASSCQSHRCRACAARAIICDGASRHVRHQLAHRFTANAVLAPAFTRWITNTESCARRSAVAAVQLTGPQSDADAVRHPFHERRDLIVRRLNEVPGFHAPRPAAPPRVAQRHRGMSADRCAFRGTAPPTRSRPAWPSWQTSTGPRVEGDGQHIRFSYAGESAIEQGIDRIDAFMRKSAYELRPTRRATRYSGASALRRVAARPAPKTGPRLPTTWRATRPARSRHLMRMRAPNLSRWPSACRARWIRSAASTTRRQRPRAILRARASRRMP